MSGTVVKLSRLKKKKDTTRCTPGTWNQRWRGWGYGGGVDQSDGGGGKRGPTEMVLEQSTGVTQNTFEDNLKYDFHLNLIFSKLSNLLLPMIRNERSIILKKKALPGKINEQPGASKKIKRERASHDGPPPTNQCSTKAKDRGYQCSMCALLIVNRHRT